MSYSRQILDRKVGRNAQLFARAIARLDTPRARFPYLRILVSLVEEAHPEWKHSRKKHLQVAQLVSQLADDTICPNEVNRVVEARATE